MLRNVLAAIAAILVLTLAPATTGAPRQHFEMDRDGTPSKSTCKSTGRTPVPTSNVNLIQGDGIVQIGSNKECWAPQNEPALAVDPANPNHLIAGANDYRLCCDSVGRNDGTGWAYISHNGGKTWKNRLLPALTRETAGVGKFSTTDSAGDPSVAFSANGKTAFYANIVFNRSGYQSGIALSQSRDGGEHWLMPKMLAYANDPTVFLDKEWVTTGPHGLVAVTFTLFKGSGFV